LAERVNLEGQLSAIWLDHHLPRQVNFQLIPGCGFHFLEQGRNLFFGKNNWKEAVLETIVEENVGVRRRNNRPEPVLQQRPGSMLTAGAAAEVLARQKNGGALIARLIQHEIGVQWTLAVVHARLTVIQIAQFIEQIGPESGALDGF